MLDRASTPRCPYCGFTVFTNRYPKCERCHRQLPSDLSKAELDAVLARERDERAQRARSTRQKEDAGSTVASYPLQSNIGQDFVEGLIDLGSSLPDIDI